MRIAILGAGFMGSTHARAFAQIDGVEVAAIVAQSPDRGAPLAAELGARFTQSADEIFADGSIDAVSICLPTPFHRGPAEAALAAGKHVLLEKPITLDLAEADALVALAGQSDRVVMMAHVLRFWPEYVELASRALSGELGAPVSAMALRRQAFPAWSQLFSRPDLTGGAVIDMLIHDIDALNWLFGTPVAVSARGRRNPGSGGWDQAQIMIEYADGGSAMIDGGMLMPDSYRFSSSLHLLCERGAIEYDFRAGGRSLEEGEGTNRLTLFPAEGAPEVLAAEAVDPYLAECRYFVDCVRNGAPAERATPADARVALAVALAARESLEGASLGAVPVPRH
ncbi:MAG: Gfo/Idh/MocA family oxidoreductase [Thermomicrobiales bacterium]|nr:Gfo/Idh/MocA family oxidoreductase [Thermomicrobiales bacterium]